MPLYEWHCPSCDRSFEGMAALRDAKRRRACPACGNSAPRVISATALQLGRPAEPAEPRKPEGRSDVTKLQVPTVARPCWMDDRSASRFAAYKQGRGAEYDDTTAARAELRKQRGIEEKPAAASHAHGHAHSHSHSPLADSGVRARRAAAARRSIAK